MLGDIGGFTDALLIIGKLFKVASITIKGNQLNDFLLESIFIKQPIPPSKSQNCKGLEHIKMREPIRITRWQCFRQSRQKRMYSRGLARVDRELDVVRFIKLQMTLKSMRNIMFTKADRFLLSHHREQVLWSNSESDPLSSDLEFKEIPHQTPFYPNLLKTTTTKSRITQHDDSGHQDLQDILNENQGEPEPQAINIASGLT